MDTKQNLEDKLMAEIEKRKSKKIESINNVAPRDEFLNGLLESLNTGRESKSTNLIKIVDNKIDGNVNEIQKHGVSNTISSSINNRKSDLGNIDMLADREEQLHLDVEKKRKKILAESIQEYANMPQVGEPMLGNIHSSETQMGFNGVQLNETVKRMVNGYLAENITSIVEEAVRDVIIEMYAVDRIKSVLNENKEIIKKIVYETIKELQVKAKQNKTKF